MSQIKTKVYSGPNPLKFGHHHVPSVTLVSNIPTLGATHIFKSGDLVLVQLNENWVVPGEGQALYVVHVVGAGPAPVLYCQLLDTEDIGLPNQPEEGVFPTDMVFPELDSVILLEADYITWE